MRRTLAVALVLAVVIGSLAGATRVGTGAAPPEVDDRETFTVHTEAILMQDGGQICAEALQEDVNEVTIRNAQLEGTTMYYDGPQVDKVISLPSADLDGELVLYTNGENGLVNTLAQLGLCVPIDQPVPVTLEVYYLTADSLDVDDMEIEAGEGIADDAPEPGGLSLSDLLGNLSLSESTSNESDGSGGNQTLENSTGGNATDGNVTDGTEGNTSDAVTDTNESVENATDETDDTVDDTTDTVNETVDETTDESSDTVDDTSATVDDTADDTADTVNESADTVDDTVDDTSDTVDDTTDETNETLNETTNETTDTLGDTVNETTSTVEDTVNQTVSTVEHTVNETLSGGSDDSTTDDTDSDEGSDDDGLLPIAVGGLSFSI